MKQLFMLLATAALYAQTVALYAATPQPSPRPQ